MAKSKTDGIPHEQVEEDLRQQKFSPVYLFFGEEDFLIEQTVDLLIKQALDETAKSFNLDIVQGSDVDAKDIVSLASAYPMMSERRVVVVREIDRLADKEPLIPFIENPSPTTLFVLISEKADFRLKFYKSLQTHAVVVRFNQLYEDKIPMWIENRIVKLGKKITSEACQLLQSHVGRSLREIQNEIDKLFIYIGDKKLIDVDDVNAVVGTSKRYNIFELQKAIGKKDIATAQEIMERMMDAGEYPVSMIVMLTKYFQKLWLIPEVNRKGLSEYQLASMLGIKQYFLKEYIEAARNYSSIQITKCFATLLEADETLKSSGRDEKLIMTLMVYKLINSNSVNFEQSKRLSR